MVPIPRAAAVDEQDLAGLDVGGHEDVGPDRAGDLRQGRGVHEVDPGRDREQLARGDGDLLGVPPAGQQRADLVADRPAVDPVAELRRCARSPRARVRGGAGRRVVVALSLHDVRAVHPRGDHLDDDLSGSGIGSGTFERGPRVRRVRGGDRDDDD